MSDMETKLENIQQQIDYKQQSLDNLLELRQKFVIEAYHNGCLLYTSPSPRDRQKSRMPSSA